ncbi:hypothetical protein MKW98_003698 [Papaver atlanticum]|uniref:Uncharacterized protein n=1 Tax=Papaver atlanticum TaxID=357466 RepID=A0AAD4SJ60_9MAGN|nr:hypothetical protein MKW98_003698 [Papaver atlanticum]
MEQFYDTVSVDSRINVSRRPSYAVLCSKELNERIREMFTKVELSVSSYDTAWVAMVPSPISPQSPCFPKCVGWILENQLSDGSWCIAHDHPLLIKDSLSSTLACILALKKWDVGEEHVNKGLRYIGSNFSLVNDKNQHAPIGFDIIFPNMIEYAQTLGINLPLSTSTVDALLQKRDLEIRRVSETNSEGSKLYLAYIAEGVGKHHGWKDIMKYQRKNGSLFNSPSATAAAFVHLQDTNCLNYLSAVSEKFGSWVPTAYPLDIYVSLSLVDNLERLGIDRHFKGEIQSLLDTIYRCWLDMDEEIFSDMTTCAVAFRILRMHGYDISSDALVGEPFFDTPGGYNKDLQCALELYRASQIMIRPDESILERQNMRSSNFLKQCLSKRSIHTDVFNKVMIQEVEYALKFPFYAQFERVENKRYMEHYNSDNLSILKTAYRSSNIESKDLLELAVEDFNICQSIHRKELQQLERWIKENRLDKLKFSSRHVSKLNFIHFTFAATLFSPELSDARLLFSKSTILVLAVDDFFDGGGSREELVNLVELFDKWRSGIPVTDFYSENVEIIISAFQNAVDDFGEEIFSRQGYRATSQLIEMWHSVINANMKETEWYNNKVVPTFDEYMANACVTVLLVPIAFPALHLLGPDVPEEVHRGTEFLNLAKAMNTCGRLLNDIQTLKKETEAGKLINAVSLLMSSGNVTEEEAVKKVQGMIKRSRTELLRLAFHSKDSGMPRACKELLWIMNKQMEFTYMSNDTFTTYNDGVTNSQEIVSVVNAIFEERLHVPPYATATRVCNRSSISGSKSEEPEPAAQ